MDDVATGTMSMISIDKTRRFSGLGENVADTLAKGELTGLERLGITIPPVKTLSIADGLGEKTSGIASTWEVPAGRTV